MYRIARRIDFCYGHRLLDYPGKCRYLHGHNGRVEILLEVQELDARGMVADFTEVDRAVKSWIDENLDHRMLLRRDDPLVAALEAAGEPFYLMETSPTAEAIAGLLFRTAHDLGFPVIEVRLWETPDSMATYRPR